MASINRVVLVGHLTKDPEIKHTAGGTAICEFGIALNSREKNGEEWQDRVDFFDVTVFGEQGEACAQYLAKGKQVGVEGRLRQDRWEDKDTSQKRSRVKVIATGVQFLTPAGDSNGGDGGQAAHEAGDPASSAEFDFA